MSSKIYQVTAREILDSRGYPTVEVTVILESGYRATASVPTGGAVVKYEAVELRDGDKNRYDGLGVLKAVANVNKTINDKVKGLDASDQKTIDKALISLDGTSTKARLGSNAILGVSLGVSAAMANHLRMPLYRYLNQLFTQWRETKLEKIPSPIFNVINGGLHGAGNLNFQEFQVIPATSHPFHIALEMGVDIYQAAKKILIYRNAIHSIGDEGGFCPNLYTNLDALEVLLEAIKNTHFRFGFDVFTGLDLAASSFYSQARGYQLKDRPVPYKPEEFVNYLQDIHKKYHILILEDALEQDDWSNWSKITKLMGEDVLIVGDDLLATNIDRLKKAISQKACSAILAKPNQIGTLSEFFDVVAEAKKHDVKVITSHRSGETNDTFIADLSVAIASDYIKFGAPARGERIAKYNRLLAIESEIFPYS